MTAFSVIGAVCFGLVFGAVIYIGLGYLEPDDK